MSFAAPNLLIQEQSIGIHYNQGAEMFDYSVDPSPFKFVGGVAARPTGPGLGIEVDEAAVRRAVEVGHRWRNPIWHHRDGSFPEW